MAASDPTFDVPTPTGTLQGVAAFSWDGSAWQPSGRAGPAVATPTGTLQGVAPFFWDGANWQAAGRASPGVATPTGVLDGVAVYTWSGSAWTPASGTATPATPTGALRGVAAFNWDGSAWQPAAQARPSVATPYGVLDGVAMFGWTGSAWSAAVQGPALNMSFMAPGALDARVAFTRASTATYLDTNGTIQTAAINTPRWEYSSGTLRGLLLEDAKTNLVPNSSPVTGWTPSNVTPSFAGTAPDGVSPMVRLAETAANTFHIHIMTATIIASTRYNLSAYAKAAENRYLQLYLDDNASNGGYATFDLQAGTISGALTTAGTGTIGTASILPIGNGVYRCSIAATAGTGTTARVALTLANTAAPGSFPGYAGNTANGLLVWGVQLEAASFPSSYIPTSGAAATRAQDRCIIPSANMAPWFAPAAGSWFIEFIRSAPSIAGDTHILSGPVEGSAAQPMTNQGSGNLQTYDGNNWCASANTISGGVITKGSSTWAANVGRVCLSGGAVASIGMTTGFSSLAASGVGFLVTSPTAGSANNMTGYLRNVRYWPRVLSDTEMQSVTT